MSMCRKCGKPIQFIKMESGKYMPCDVDLVEYWAEEGAPGKVITQRLKETPNGKMEYEGIVVSCQFDGDKNKSSGFGHISHFATCSVADSFRKEESKK